MRVGSLPSASVSGVRGFSPMAERGPATDCIRQAKFHETRRRPPMPELILAVDMVKAAAGARAATADFDGRQSSHPGTAAGHRTCIVVLGMHRSGTSAPTRVLSILGAAMPRHVMTGSGSSRPNHP
jgi:hypothetical protein